MDLKDVQLVVNFTVPKSLNALTQRFGRGARNRDVNATVILLAQPQFFIEYQEEQAAKKAEKEAKKAQKKGSKRTKNNPLPLSGNEMEVDRELMECIDAGPLRRLDPTSWWQYSSDPIEVPSDAEIEHDDGHSALSQPLRTVPQPVQVTETPKRVLQLKDPNLSRLKSTPTPIKRGTKRPRKSEGHNGDSEPEFDNPKAQVDSALHDFINAHRLNEDDPRRGCLRKVLNAYYGNDQLCM